MAPNALLEHEPITWPIRSFVVDHDFTSPSNAYLLLDRANADFGLFFHIAAGVGTMAQLPDDEPVYFEVSRCRAACSRPGLSCRKVCVLMQHTQIDLEFSTADHASNFMQSLGRLATKVRNMEFEVFEAPSLSALNRLDYSIEKMCNMSKRCQASMRAGDADTFDWAKVYKSGKCFDFTVIAGGRSFPVHRVLLCSRSQYFNAVCDGSFSETEQKSISLPESDGTVSVMLQELYGVYNSTTGSIFTSFALQREIEKEAIISNLLDYNLESIKNKIAHAIIDRMPFIHDVVTIVDVAACIYDESCPEIDCGLRKAIIVQIHARLSTIMDDEAAWQAYSGNKAVLKALHEYQCAAIEETALQSPPASPTTPGKHYKQVRPSGG
ncbi:hypothetical protein HBI56_032390 [Parastagonospora nodorum]|nr:hypothetical protein HBH56_020120 [Parastagonospora nodorum]KAH3937579.1 hypothetical protein HBH54_014390 [Parastagonospora nodorum]KAH3953806.1 hypothetical protein HBH53_026550 [Parastagonospora nodorum]KAH3967658.1 hypothetical protein HBH51_138060 [Parastagonospora nodorum]KAH3990799.1 hypothetical protein HBH52_003280 [Parastagonospora nodorum]